MPKFLHSEQGIGKTMIDIARFVGPKAFGKAYQHMLENDTHAPGSVDRALATSMIRLCEDTAAYLYDKYTDMHIGYVKGSRPVLEHALSEVYFSATEPGQLIPAIANFTRGLAAKRPRGLDAMRFGGTEEQIIERGSEWCTDVARVGCALYQIAGLPCRIVNLFNLNAAYSGHVIVEVYSSETWGAVDTNSGVVYRKDGGAPATTWELMNDAELVNRHKSPEAWCTAPEQFSSAGISNYYVREAMRYDYAVSGINDYCRAILSMGGQGWPGGLRWLHGEDGEQ